MPRKRDLESGFQDRLKKEVVSSIFRKMVCRVWHE